MNIVTVPGPSGKAYSVKIAGDTPTAEEQARIDSYISQQEASSPQARYFGTPTEPEAEQGGLGTALGVGWDTVQQGYGSALEGAGSVTGIMGLQNYGKSVAEANAAEAAEKAKFLTGREDIDGFGSLMSFAGETIAQQLPQFGISAGGASAGAMAGSFFGPLGTAAGAIIGGTAANLPFFYGQNRERQKEAIDRGLRTEMDEGAAFLASIPQASLDAIVDRFMIGKILNPDFIKAGGILTRAVKGGTAGIVTEVPTEIGQAIIERYQAGLPIDDEEAIREYEDVAIAAGLVGGAIGGTANVSSGDIRKKREAEKEVITNAQLAEDLDEDAAIAKTRLDYGLAAVEKEAQESQLTPTAEEKAARGLYGDADPKAIALPAPSRVPVGDQRLAAVAPKTEEITPPRRTFETEQYNAALDKLYSIGKFSIPAIQSAVAKTTGTKVPVSVARDIRDEMVGRGVLRADTKSKEGFVLEPKQEKPFEQAESLQKTMDDLQKTIEADRKQREAAMLEVRRLEQMGGTKQAIRQKALEVDAIGERITTNEQVRLDTQKRLANADVEAKVPTTERPASLIKGGQAAVPLVDAPPEAQARGVEQRTGNLQTSLAHFNSRIKEQTNVLRRMKAQAQKVQLPKSELEKITALEQSIASDKYAADALKARIKNPSADVQMAQEANAAAVARETAAKAARAAKTPIYTGQEQRVFNALVRRLKNLGLSDVRLTAEKMLRPQGAPDNALIEGMMNTEDGNVVISLAMSVYKPGMTDQELFDAISGVMNHEVIHALKNLGLFTDAEWKTLSEVARRQKYMKVKGGKAVQRDYTYFQRAQQMYADAGVEIQTEEAVAEMFRDYVDGKLKIGGKPRTLMDRIKAFFKAVWQAHADAEIDPNTIFEGIRYGEIGRRERQPQAPQAERQSIVDLGKAREDKQIKDFHKGFMDDIQSRVSGAQDAFVQAVENGVFDGYEVGDVLRGKVAPIKITGRYMTKWKPTRTSLDHFGRFNAKPDITEVDGVQYIPMLRYTSGSEQSGDLQESSLYLDLVKAAGYQKMGGLKPVERLSKIIATDNPGGEWLKTKQARAEEDMARTDLSVLRSNTKKGLRGPTTAYTREPVMLPTELVSGLEGASGENRVPGDLKYDQLNRLVENYGWMEDQDGNAIVVGVNHKGQAYLIEGNTRTAVAKARGIPTIRAEVRWFNGGETAGGPITPEIVASVATPASKASPRFSAIAVEDTLSPAQRREVEETQREMARFSAVNTKTIPDLADWMTLLPTPVKTKDGKPSYVYGAFLEGGRMHSIYLSKGNHTDLPNGARAGFGMAHIVGGNHDKELFDNSRYTSVEQAIFDILKKWEQQGHKSGEWVTMRPYAGNITLEWRDGLTRNSPPLTLVLTREGPPGWTGNKHAAMWVKTFFPELPKAKQQSPKKYSMLKLGGVYDEERVNALADDSRARAITRMQDNGDTPDRISTRQPKNLRATEDPLTENLIIDLASMKRNQVAFAHNMDVIRAYPGFVTQATDPDTVAEDFIRFVGDNLTWLYDRVPANIRGNSKLWYNGARRITEIWSGQYQLPDFTIAGVLAALSPQKDWYQNVSLAERLIDIHSTFSSGNMMGYFPDQNMAATGQRIYGKPQYRNALTRVLQSPYSDLVTDVDRAMWLRIYDEANNPRGFRRVSPDGHFIGEPEGNVAWGSNVEIAKAIFALRTQDRDATSAAMGEKHKVRNFYNNILAPDAPHGDVTIDTHAVAAALLRPLSGNSEEVHHNFGSSPETSKRTSSWRPAKNDGDTGASGTYGLYAEAYRRVAERLGVLPRELQSITWEAVRGLFPATDKRNRNLVGAVNREWAKVSSGEQTAAEARELILDVMGGVNDPTWHGLSGAAANRRGPSSYEGELAADRINRQWLGRGVDGGDAGRDSLSGGRSGIAGGGVREGSQQGAGRDASVRQGQGDTRFKRTSTSRRDAADTAIAVRRGRGRGMADEGVWIVPRGGREAGSDVLRYTVSPDAMAEYQSAGIETPDIVELPKTPEAAARFHAAISSARDSHGPQGKSVFVYDEADYEGMRLFLTDDGMAGFALKEQDTPGIVDIVSVFNSQGGPKKVSYPMMRLAVELGGNTLDAFDIFLPRIYSANGFRVKSRMTWNDEYKPDGWDYDAYKQFNEGRPDVVFMYYDPERQDTYTRGEGDYFVDYDRAALAQQTAALQAKERARFSIIPTAPRYAATSAMSPSTRKQVATAQSNLMYARSADLIAKILHGRGYGLNKDSAKRFADNTLRKFQDSMLPVGRMVQELAQRGLTITDAMDPYLKEMLMHGIVGDRITANENALFKPMVETIKKLNIPKTEIDKLKKASDLAAPDGKGYVTYAMERSQSPRLALADAYLYAKHAKERNKFIREVRDPNNTAGSGMTDAEADAILNFFNSLQGENRNLIHAMALNARAIVADTNKTRLEAGLISQDVIDSNVFSFYVPLRGKPDVDPDLEREQSRPPSNPKLGAKGREDSRITGRYDAASEIVANLMNQNQNAILRGERNKVGQAFLQLMRADGTETYGKILDRKPTMKGVTASGKNVEVVDQKRLNDTDMLTVKENGKEVVVQLWDERLAIAMNGQNGMSTLNNLGAVKFMSKVNRYLASINTSYNPEFMITNAFRDLQTAGVNVNQFEQKAMTKEVVKNLGSALKGIKRSIRDGDDSSEWSKIYKDFVAAGGQNSTNMFDTLADRMENIKGILGDVAEGGRVGNWNKVKRSFVGKGVGSMLDFLEDYNTVIENGVRVTTYKGLLDRGYSRERAAQAARTVTVNFAKSGEYRTLMNSMYLFYNASLQGSFALLNAAVRSPKVRKLWLGIMAAGVANDLLQSMLSGEDDDEELKYDKIPDHVLEHNIVFMDPFGLTERSYFTIPMPYGLNMAYNAGRAMSRAGRQTYTPEEAGLSILGPVLDTLNPVGGTESFANFAAPTVLDPFVDLMQNEDFAGKPIYKEGLPFDRTPAPDSQLYWNSTSPSAVWISKNLNELTGGNAVRSGFADFSPDVLEFWYSFLTGGVGRFVQSTGELPTNVASLGFDDDLVRTIPLARKVFGAVSEREDMGSYIDRASEVLMAGEELKQAKEAGDLEWARETIAKYPNELKMLGKVKAFESSLRKLSKQKNEITKNTRMPESQKRLMLEKIEERRQQVLAAANRALRDL